MLNAIITIGISPDIHLGPLTLAWHGITIALGILAGGIFAGRYVRNRGLAAEPMSTFGMLAVVGGLVGGRIFYVVEHGGPLLGTRGFTFDGGFLLAAALIAIYARRVHLDPRYLDAAAVALPLGVAIGRIGDLINGEHYGNRSDSLLAVRNSNPAALTPDSRLSYINGGLYEMLLALAVFGVMWSLRDRLPRRGDLAWAVLVLFSVGRFFEFFARDDSPQLALGLNNAQWTSLAIVIVVLALRTLVVRRPGRAKPPRDRLRPGS